MNTFLKYAVLAVILLAVIAIFQLSTFTCVVVGFLGAYYGLPWLETFEYFKNKE